MEGQHLQTDAVIPVPQFTYYQGPITNAVPNSLITLAGVYYLIISKIYAPVTNGLRDIRNKKEAREYKKWHFNYVTFSGLFSRRSNDCLIKHSGLLTVDFDHVGDISELKENLLRDQYFETQLLFTSPSGDGLKWIISIDPSLEFHHRYFDAVSRYVLAAYKIEIDLTGREVSRACFLPHDPDAYINPKYL